MAETRFGTFDELMAESEAALRPIATRLREMVCGIHPEAVEVVRLGDRAATYGLGPKMMSEGYCYVLPYRKWVNFGFYKGAELPDPDGCSRVPGPVCATSRCARSRRPSDRRRGL